ncbi:MAG: hypothetical protein IPG53_10525 [Ignavibacteriales bacterium]|nr:hypothetical protein [Ignavibacteriales bacterium]
MIVTIPIVTTKSILFSALLFLLINLPSSPPYVIKKGNPNPPPYTLGNRIRFNPKVVDLCLSGDTI